MGTENVFRTFLFWLERNKETYDILLNCCALHSFVRSFVCSNSHSRCVYVCLSVNSFFLFFSFLKQKSIFMKLLLRKWFRIFFSCFILCLVVAFFIIIFRLVHFFFFLFGQQMTNLEVFLRHFNDCLFIDNVVLLVKRW